MGTSFDLWVVCDLVLVTWFICQPDRLSWPSLASLARRQNTRRWRYGTYEYNNVVQCWNRLIQILCFCLVAYPHFVALCFEGLPSPILFRFGLQNTIAFAPWKSPSKTLTALYMILLLFLSLSLVGTRKPIPPSSSCPPLFLHPTFFICTPYRNIS